MVTHANRGALALLVMTAIWHVGSAWTKYNKFKPKKAYGRAGAPIGVVYGSGNVMPLNWGMFEQISAHETSYAIREPTLQVIPVVSITPVEASLADVDQNGAEIVMEHFAVSVVHEGLVRTIILDSEDVEKLDAGEKLSASVLADKYDYSWAAACSRAVIMKPRSPPPLAWDTPVGPEPRPFHEPNERWGSSAGPYPGPAYGSGPHDMHPGHGMAGPPPPHYPPGHPEARRPRPPASGPVHEPQNGPYGESSGPGHRPYPKPITNGRQPAQNGFAGPSAPPTYHGATAQGPYQQTGGPPKHGMGPASDGPYGPGAQISPQAKPSGQRAGTESSSLGDGQASYSRQPSSSQARAAQPPKFRPLSPHTMRAQKIPQNTHEASGPGQYENDTDIQKKPYEYSSAARPVYTSGDASSLSQRSSSHYQAR